MGADHSLSNQVVFFDGVCNLCNTSVQFILKRDKRKLFFFASLQSDYAKDSLPRELIQDGKLQSIVLKNEKGIFKKSDAVLAISKQLPGLWPVLYVFALVPSGVRNWVYDLVAQNRYRWFGKQDQCMLPTSGWKDRFLD